MSLIPVANIAINYDEQKRTLTEFLKEYRSSRDEDVLMVGDEPAPKYMELLQKVANRQERTVQIDLDDLFEFEKNNKVGRGKMLVHYIEDNAATYVRLLSEVVDSLMPLPTVDITYRDEVLDVILYQRRQRNERVRQEMESDPNSATDFNDEMFPPELLRRYYLYFKPLTAGPNKPFVHKPLACREVRSDHLGQLITVRAMVTRVSDVRPQVAVAAYTCDKCGNEIFQEVKTRQYTPLTECPSPECKQNNSKGQLFPSTRASKFVPFQDVRIQELTDQVPTGEIPRSLNVSIRGTLVRCITAGDLVDISGIFLPRPYTGFKAIRAGLLTDTYLETEYVRAHKKQYNLLHLSDPVKQKLWGLRDAGNVYQRLAMSLAPEIYGMDDVKKALLLLLVGGVTKEIGDGMRIRGDINICLMGDPGVAKSQLLKYISKVAPRGVYTTGKGSSGVGLTAAVIRDPVTDELMLEGGALVLADGGVCCIDEFDKMDESDRTAIHEVMEQQTISIAKAGMATTLNARTSILAAANPIYGRYNPKATPMENINLPAALLSRFDLLFLILDKPNEITDTQLAEHITHVHIHQEAPELTFEPVDPGTIREYIALAREHRPLFPKEVAKYASQAYVQMRQREKIDEQEKKNGFGHITPRSLLGMLRLAQAHARLHFSDNVSFEDVNEAIRLNECSKQTLWTDNSAVDQYIDRSTLAYRIIRDHFDNLALDSMPRSEVESMVLRRGLTQTDLDRFYELYADAATNQFYLDSAGTTLYKS